MKIDTKPEPGSLAADSHESLFSKALSNASQTGVKATAAECEAEFYDVEVDAEIVIEKVGHLKTGFMPNTTSNKMDVYLECQQIIRRIDEFLRECGDKIPARDAEKLRGLKAGVAEAADRLLSEINHPGSAQNLQDVLSAIGAALVPLGEFVRNHLPLVNQF